jgi:hypothetical protein
MFAWSKEDVLNMKLPEEWTKGVFEISVEDPMSSLMVIWVCGEAARQGPLITYGRKSRNLISWAWTLCRIPLAFQK